MSVTRCAVRNLIPAGVPDTDAADFMVAEFTIPDTSDARDALDAIRLANAPTYSGSDAAIITHRTLIATGGPRVTQAQMEALGMYDALVDLAEWSAT